MDTQVTEMNAAAIAEAGAAAAADRGTVPVAAALGVAQLDGAAAAS